MSDASPPADAIPELSHSIAAGQRGSGARYLKDRAARMVVLVGGMGVIVALLLIFVYLLSEVAPLFSGASVHARKTFAMPGDPGRSLYVAAEEQGEVGMRAADSGRITFFDLRNGEVRGTADLPVGGHKVTHVELMAPERSLLAAALDDGSVVVFTHSYAVSFPNDQRVITPKVDYPSGDKPIPFLSGPATSFTARDEGDRLMLAGGDASGQVSIKSFEQTTSFTGETSMTESPLIGFKSDIKPDLLLLEPQMHWLYVVERESGKMALYRLKDGEAPTLVQVVETGSKIADARYLAGGISVVLGQADGKVSQWFPARKPDGETWYLAHVRDFKVRGNSPVTTIGPEMRRRGFAVGDASGKVTMFYATTGARTHEEQAFESPVERLVFNSRAQVLVAEAADGQVRVDEVRNEHPEVSFSALWTKVWYESYDEPKYLWQSSSASADFEPKFSLAPLAVGTAKGAFYAMIFAIPLAVLGAIFTANFMTPELRQVVKPSVEVLAALPSVILGFLAGLWLAPLIENNLAGVFLALLLLPLSMPIFGFIWTKMPRAIRLRVPGGWEALLLVPVIVGILWLCLALAHPIEAVFFHGNIQAWMDHTLGVSYTQRNSLVVGIAMGIAVVPVIFSIAEDAIFSVPRHLSLGSLALGATPWQTLVGVVLPTASPGIFSAVMIGMGRAVGETMIVLMATGNTAVMDLSMFNGMRTLAANVAVEMPESEVGSTHFRLLFLSGLVLFIFTFVINTLAEVVRSRLRRKYSSL